MPENWHSADSDPIRHVVVLMLENHSFDQMLGDFQSKYPALDGIDRTAAPRTNLDPSGHECPQVPTTARSVSPDPKHELAHVLRQIESEAPAVYPQTRMHRICRALRALFEIIVSWLRRRRTIGAMKARPPYRGAFVLDYAQSYPETTREQWQQIMGFYERGTLPALHALAEHFTLCDRWFASVPGPTWTNRFFVHTGTSMGIVRMPDDKWDIAQYDVYDQTTVFDRLNESKTRWRIYYHDVPQSLALLHQLRRENKERYCQMDDFESHVAGSEADFPEYVFIEPQYLEPDPNDDHPPYDIFAAQALMARVYNAIRANESLWNRTLLVILYDEHGGFFDHVETPTALAPDRFSNEYTFDRLGVRVPALLVSPWVDAGVFSETLDHTSLLRYLSDKWRLGSLGSRVENAKSFADAIRRSGSPRADTPTSIPSTARGTVYAMREAGPKMTGSLNENQQALDALSKVLEAKARMKGRGGPIEMLQADSAPTHSQAAAARIQRFLKAD